MYPWCACTPGAHVPLVRMRTVHTCTCTVLRLAPVCANIFLPHVGFLTRTHARFDCKFATREGWEAGAHVRVGHGSCPMPVYGCPSTCRLAPTCEWDTAAADIIVREAGGVVLHAGQCDSDGKALEDWRVRACVRVCLRA